MQLLAEASRSRRNGICRSHQPVLVGMHRVIVADACQSVRPVFDVFKCSRLRKEQFSTAQKPPDRMRCGPCFQESASLLGSRLPLIRPPPGGRSMNIASVLDFRRCAGTGGLPRWQRPLRGDNCCKQLARFILDWPETVDKSRKVPVKHPLPSHTAPTAARGIKNGRWVYTEPPW